MKPQYILLVILLFLITIIYGYNVLSNDSELHPQLDHFLQGLGVFVALLASVFALATSNPKVKTIKTNINHSVEDKKGSITNKSKLDDEIISNFENYPDPITTHMIDFTLKNTSGFTLKKPTLTFRLPKNRRHPGYDKNYLLRDLRYNSNLFNNPDDFKTLEFLDSVIISNSNLPYWNNKDEMTIWIRMAIASQPKFNIEISLNCENAEGVTREVEIDPEKLLT